MFDLTFEEQQQACAAKPVESLEQLTTNLGMDELVEPTTLVEIQNVIWETFGDWARKVNPTVTGRKCMPTTPCVSCKRSPTPGRAYTRWSPAHKTNNLERLPVCASS